MSSKWELWKEKNNGDTVRPWDMINPKIKKLPKKDFNKLVEKNSNSVSYPSV